MTSQDRQALLNALCAGIPPVLEREMAELARHDVSLIEPLVDAMVEQAALRGKLEAWYAIAEAQERDARVAAKFDSEAMQQSTPF